MVSGILQQVDSSTIGDFFAGEAELPESYWSLAKAVNWLFAKAEQEHIKDLSPIKLQKMLYFMHGACLREIGRPLIREHAQAWQYGPVFPTAYHEYKMFGSQPISLGKLYYMGEMQTIKGAIVKIKPEPINDDETLQKVLHDSVMKHKNKDGMELSDLTHREELDNPWAQSRDFSNKIGISNFIMPNAKIKQYFAAHPEL